MGEQGVDQRAILVAGGGMHHQPSRLIEHQQVGILKQNFERDILLRGGAGGYRGGWGELIEGAGAHRFGGGGERGAIDGGKAGFNQGFDARTRKRAVELRQETIGALAGRSEGGDNGERRGFRIGGFGHFCGIAGFATIWGAIAVRGMKALVIGMGVAIVILTTVIMVKIAHLIATPHAVSVADTLLEEPAGTRIIGVSNSGTSLAIALSGGGADRVIVVDLATGHRLGSVRLAN